MHSDALTSAQALRNRRWKTDKPVGAAITLPVILGRALFLRNIDDTQLSVLLSHVVSFCPDP